MSLVEPEWLKERLDNLGNIVIVDCYYKPGQETEYKSEFAASFMNERRLTAFARKLGINEDSHVVCLDRSEANCGFFSATRLWWLLKTFGFDNVSVLNGGFRKWKALGFPTTNEPTPIKEGNFVAKWRREWYCSYEDFLRLKGKPGVAILDARSPDAWAGKVKGQFAPS